MFITITSIQLKSLWGFFELSLFGFKIVMQTRKQKGFIQMRNTGFGYWHYTMSVWQTEEDIKNFARSGAHLEAMKNTSKLAHQVQVYTYQADKLPTWKEAKSILAENARVLRQT